MKSHRFTPAAAADQRLEVAIGSMLRTGVSIAAAVMLIGGLLYLRQANGPAPDYRHFYAAPAEALHLRSTFEGIRHGASVSIIQLGILLLIATPVVRVVFAMVGFAREGDRLYTWISAVVFAILVFSLVHGR